MIILVYCFLLAVLLDGNRVSALTDGRLSTCITLPESYFRTQAVVTFVLKKPYDNSVDVLVQGRGMVCELSHSTCRKGFTTTVIRQGRTNQTCVEQPSPCPGAATCESMGMRPHYDGMVSCRYHCRCPVPADDEDISCETILFSIGNGARAEIGEDIEICSLNVDWYRWVYHE